MTQEEMRLALVNSTVKVVANDGLDKTTTKAISTVADLNEVYIYRLFEGKEDLLRKSFELLARELAENVMKNISVMHEKDRDFLSKGKELFCSVWNFILSNEDRCVCYMRYYYSPYFKKYSEDYHNKLFAPVVDVMTPAFAEGQDVVFFLSHILHLMLDFAIKVFDGFVTNDKETAEKFFTIIYSSIKPYLAPCLISD